ncbi:MAG: hypothetical protein ACKOXB_13330 [Flavobacteriales bacterium]
MQCFKLLILFALTMAACAESPVIQHPYNYKGKIALEGHVIGLEEMDHFNALEAKFIEHELVDETKAKAKILGRIEKINGSTIILKSDSLHYFYAVLEEPLTFNDSLLHQRCILQGLAQMEDSSQLPGEVKGYAKGQKRFLRFDTRSAIILK